MIYVFGDCELDIQRHTFCRAGQLHPLRPKVFQVLLYLLEHRDRVVTRDELCQQVWSTEYMSDATLGSTIRAVRQALGDSGRASRFIVTVARHGYRFASPVALRTSEPTASGAAPLAAPHVAIIPDIEASTPGIPHTAERRQLTVLSCALVWSVSPDDALELEDLHHLLVAYRLTCTAIAQGLEGYLAQTVGEELLFCFGYPTSREDDARRAVQCGLACVEALQALPIRPAAAGSRFAIRLGTHTGLVIIDKPTADPQSAQLIIGDAPQGAIGIQRATTPNTVTISATTWQLVREWFVCRRLQAHPFPESTLPQPLYGVLRRRRRVRHRFTTVPHASSASFIGHHEETMLLMNRWQQSREGAGHAVLLEGEAGIGKSRLVHELAQQITATACTKLTLHCTAASQHSAMYPIIVYLQQLLRWGGNDPPPTKLIKLERMLRVYDFAMDETLPLVATLIGLPLPTTYPPFHLDAMQQRQKTQEVLLTWLLAESRRHPVFLVVEDVHWADASTLELVARLLDQVPTARLMLLLTVRSAFRPAWASHSHLVRLPLSRLGRRDTETLVASLVHGREVPPVVLQQIVTTTDGIPLFVEEVTKFLLIAGDFDVQLGQDTFTPTRWRIPSTLHDLLMARLDGLGTAKTVAQLAATLGHEFTPDLLYVVSATDAPTLQSCLDRLVAVALLYRKDFSPPTRYVFKHALIREAAYQSLLRDTRQHYHQQIAEALVRHFPQVVEQQPEQVAHHYTEAGLAEPAIVFWQRAGQRAIAQSAYIEAVSHLSKGLTLLGTLPPTPQRQRTELAMNLLLGEALAVTKGHTAPGIYDLYTHARTLCHQLGEVQHLFPVLRGLWRYCMLRPRLTMARELGAELLHMAQVAQEPAFIIAAHQALGMSLAYLGDFHLACAHLTQVNAPCVSQLRDGPPKHYLSDPRTTSLPYHALATWVLGYPEQAMRLIEEALALAQELQHPFTEVTALTWAARQCQYRREVWHVYAYAEAGRVMSAKYHFPLYEAVGTILRGWAMMQQEPTASAVAQMVQGLDAWQATGARASMPYFLGLLGEAYHRTGQPQAALAVLEEALSLVQKTDERWFEAELCRLQGDCLLAICGDRDVEAEAYFSKALDLARGQQAKSWELRTTVSLARLWRQRGQSHEARQLLAEVYGWFTEGLDTVDLLEAKALLEALA